MADVSQINLPDGTTYNLKDSYARTNYVPLAGGTLTGDLLFSNSGTNIRQIKGTNGDSDAWRIAAGATGTNAGWLEIATADDYNEPIYVRQYMYAASSGVRFGTVKNEITLLDANGNTTFPKNVTATKFIGALQGNADTATNVAWTGVTGKPSTFTPSAHTHSEIYTIKDARSTATTPNDYKNMIRFQGLKKTSIIDNPSSDTFSYLVGLRGWADNSGGDAWELAFNNSGINVRHGATTTWGAWTKLLDSSNYSSYAVPLQTAGGVATCAGSGQYWYFKLATIVITGTYLNRPILFELSSRGKDFKWLEVIFNSTNNTDPSLYSFITNGDLEFWIKKTATSTWEIYGKYDQKLGIYTCHRVTGNGADIGVTINMTNYGNELPSDVTQVAYGWNCKYAVSAGSASSASTAGNVTGTVAIANGGTGATTRLNAVKNLMNEAVASPNYIMGLTTDWGKAGYTSIAQLKTTLGLGSNAYTSTAYLPLAGGTITGDITLTTTAASTGGIFPSTSGGGYLGSSNKNFYSVYSRYLYASDNIYATSYGVIGDNSTKCTISKNDISLSGTSNTWDGTNTSLKTAIASVVTYKDFTCTSASVPANSSKEFASVNVAKTGYTPIGFLKYNTGDGSITPVNLYLEGNNAILVLRNVSSTAKSVAPTFRILYMKKTS